MNSELINITLRLLAKNFVLYKAAENQPFSNHIRAFTCSNMEHLQVDLKNLLANAEERRARIYAREQKKSKQLINN